MSKKVDGCADDGLLSSISIKSGADCQMTIASKSIITNDELEDCVIVKIDSGATSRSITFSPMEAHKVGQELINIALEIQERK